MTHSLSTAHAVAEAIQGEYGGRIVKTTRGFLVRCPCHSDKDPSLSLGEGRNGSLLYHCFAGCPSEIVRAALLERGLLPSPGASEARKNTAPLPVITHEKVRDARRTLALYDLARARGLYLTEENKAAVKAARKVLALAKKFPPPQPIPWMIRLVGNEVRIDLGDRLRGLPDVRYEPILVRWPPEIGDALIIDLGAPEAVLYAVAQQCLRAGARVVRVARDYGELDVYRAGEVRDAAA